LAKTIVVFGSSGQLGVELCAELARREYDVHGFERSALNICDKEPVERALREFSPFAVFNAAAYNLVDRAESEPLEAYETNALGVRNIALACREKDTRLIHFSTDYVFDGTLGRPYLEIDATHPLGAYAVSKLAGELYAQAYLERPLIVRTCAVFGPGGRRTARGNFLETMLGSPGRETRFAWSRTTLYRLLSHPLWQPAQSICWNGILPEFSTSAEASRSPGLISRA
jgi:dTDP-4-dehydrorhamnose reductase